MSATKNKKGYLITFEGGEGGGKTTQIVRLKDKLTRSGFDVLVLREPGGTMISEQIRQVVLSTKNVGMSNTTEVLLFQAARAQIYRELVLPSLKAGKVVLMDRSRDSSVVYQGMVRGFGRELIEELNDISTNKTMPNVTILLDIDAELGLKRQTTAGGTQRLEMEDIGFHQRVRKSYLELAKEDPSRWHVVDVSKPLEEVDREIWKIISTSLRIKN